MNLLHSAVDVGWGAERAETVKTSKYSGLTDRFIFQPFAVETTGVMGPSTRMAVKDLGQRLMEASGEKLEGLWLKQRIGLAVARGNALSILAAVRQERN